MGDIPCAYPLFRTRYLSACPELFNVSRDVPLALDATESSSDVGKLVRKEVPAPDVEPKQAVEKLNLRLLSREDGPPTEEGARRHKMSLYSKKCSKVLDGLYISGEYPARNLPILKANGITHVINCVGSLYPSYHPEECEYKTLYLDDVPTENIMCILHDCFDFIEEARSNGRRVLVHCSQGVSRSATIVIGYCIWKLNKDYDKVAVQRNMLPLSAHLCMSKCGTIQLRLRYKPKSHALPNDWDRRKQILHSPTGMGLELLQWQKRRKFGVKRCFISRLAPQSEAAPLFIVPKAAAEHSWESLDSRGVFIIEVPDKLFVWVGALAHDVLVESAEVVALRIARYDHPAGLHMESVDEGQEPDELADALTPAAAARRPTMVYPRRNEAYNSDFDILNRSSPLARSPRIRGASGAAAVWGPSRLPAGTGSGGPLSATPTSARGGGETRRGNAGPVPPLQLGVCAMLDMPLSARTPN